jgi:hypothetical protein
LARKRAKLAAWISKGIHKGAHHQKWFGPQAGQTGGMDF